MGGVINLMTAPAARRTVELRSQYGNRESPKVDVTASDVWGKLGVVVDGSAFRTDGYPIVAAAERGAVDNNADGRFPQRQRQAAVRPDRSDAGERSAPATSTRIATTARPAPSTAPRKPTTRPGRRSAAAPASVCRTRARCRSACSATSRRSAATSWRCRPRTPPRSIGRMTLNQRVPTDAIGGSAQWSRGVGRNQFFTARHRLAPGRTATARKMASTPSTGTQVTLHRVSGGTQRSLGFFVQDMLDAGIRIDGHAQRAASIGGATTTATTSRTACRAARRPRTTRRRCRIATTPWRVRASPRAIT